MLLEGLKLMGVGMATVMLFLLLMIACIGLVARLTRKQAQLEEEAELAGKRSSVKQSPPQPKGAAVPVEVFVAAIAVYEEERKRVAVST